MPSAVEQVKERLSIVDVVGSYIKLTQAGQNLKAPCPFHHEKNPSFMVSPSRESFYCFGCNRGGDMFSFVQEIEGLSFIETLRLLAGRAGVELKPEDRKLRTATERLYQILEDATAFYQEKLESGTHAKKYLEGRGVNTTSSKTFRIGVAPDDWQELTSYLRGRGYKDEDMIRAGLVVKSDSGRLYDRFRNRLMFPIENSSGRVVGFSGRTLEKEDEKTAKYINTPQTLLFDKSKALYGFSRAKETMRKSDRAIVVEGQMDVVMSHQEGLAETLAVSGTALTLEHLKVISRMTKNLIFAFDRDDAGLSASKRAVALALQASMNVLITALPKGSDPADIALENPKKLKTLFDKPLHVVDYYFQDILERIEEPRKRIQELTRDVLPLIAQVKNNIDQAHFVSRIAGTLQVKEDALWAELDKVKLATEEKVTMPVQTKVESRRGMIVRQIVGVIFWQGSEKKGVIDIDKSKKRLADFLGEEQVETLFEKAKAKQEELAFEAEKYFGDSETLLETFDDLFVNLEEEVLREKLSSAIEELKQSESSQNEKDVEAKMKKCEELSKRLNDIKTGRVS